MILSCHSVCNIPYISYISCGPRLGCNFEAASADLFFFCVWGMINHPGFEVGTYFNCIVFSRWATVCLTSLRSEWSDITFRLRGYYAGKPAGEVSIGFASVTHNIQQSPVWSQCFRSGPNAVPIRDIIGGAWLWTLSSYFSHIRINPWNCISQVWGGMFSTRCDPTQYCIICVCLFTFATGIWKYFQ